MAIPHPPHPFYTPLPSHLLERPESMPSFFTWELLPFFFFLKRERDFEACNFRSNTVAICANWLEPATAVEGQHQDKEVTGVKGVITHLRLHLQFSMISKCDEQCHL